MDSSKIFLFIFLYLIFPYNWMSVLGSDSYKARANYTRVELRVWQSPSDFYYPSQNEFHKA